MWPPADKNLDLQSCLLTLRRSFRGLQRLQSTEEGGALRASASQFYRPAGCFTCLPRGLAALGRRRTKLKLVFSGSRKGTMPHVVLSTLHKGSGISSSQPQPYSRRPQSHQFSFPFKIPLEETDATGSHHGHITYRLLCRVRYGIYFFVNAKCTKP